MTNEGLIKKSASISDQQIDDVALSKINKHSLKALTSEDVFVFKIAMCDNDIDRDNEQFTVNSLNGFAKLFIGKTMIADHQWKTANQVARIYDTEVIETDKLTKTSEKFTQLIAYCYMLKNDTTHNLIAEIEAGIKKEVSIGAKVEKAICSVCGTDNAKKWCDHYPGREYDGNKCYFKLDKAVDAYEVSFVAVPSQPKAGVTKSYGANPDENKLDKETQKNKQQDSIGLRIKLNESFLFTHEMEDKN